MMGVPGNLLTLQLRILLAKNTIANGLSVFIYFCALCGSAELCYSLARFKYTVTPKGVIPRPHTVVLQLSA